MYAAPPMCASLATLLRSQLPKGQRRRLPAAVDAYAQQAARFGQTMDAMDEIETARAANGRRRLSPPTEAWARKTWSSACVAPKAGSTPIPTMPCYLTAVGAHVRARASLGQGEAVPRRRAGDRTERGRLGSPLLGDVSSVRTIRNLLSVAIAVPLALARGEATEALPDELRSRRIDTRVTAVEERDQHGVPRLSP